MDPLDRIEKRIDLRAPIERVWRALTDHVEFGQWFGVALNEPFVVGRPVTGTFHMEIDEARMIEHQRSLGVEPSGIRLPAPNAVFCTVERTDPPGPVINGYLHGRAGMLSVETH